MSLDGELRLSVVHCCSCSSFQFCNTFIGDLRPRPCAASCVCILSTSVTSVRSGGAAEAAAGVFCKILYIAANLRTNDRHSGCSQRLQRSPFDNLAGIRLNWNQNGCTVDLTTLRLAVVPPSNSVARPSTLGRKERQSNPQMK